MISTRTPQGLMRVALLLLLGGCRQPSSGGDTVAGCLP